MIFFSVCVCAWGGGGGGGGGGEKMANNSFLRQIFFGGNFRDQVSVGGEILVRMKFR